jgi:outer membrane receptor for ferrienterochelin and colicins
MRAFWLILLIIFSGACASEAQEITGQVKDRASGLPIAGARIVGANSSRFLLSDAQGRFKILLGDDSLRVFAVGYETGIIFPKQSGADLLVWLVPVEKEMDAVVVSGTLRPMHRLESPVAVEVYSAGFFKKNPAPSIFESLSNVNGVRPQLNCSVCNTGDIHINGLEGPYTMVTIDGMPIVSSLGSVYGLFGIPTQLIDRVEIVKGPASGLYGPEAIGGLINIITKEADKAPGLAVNAMSSSWWEHSIDLGWKTAIGRKIDILTGIDYFRFQNTEDRNRDGFTDVALQHRISVFQKWNFKRRQNRIASIAGRYFYEDRWGGDMRWNAKFRGSDSLYGESIYTRRWELIGKYQLPVKENIVLSFSATSHQQNSWYGITPYMGDQRIAFGQLIWDRPLGVKHDLLLGAALRYNYYDDNSTATLDTFSQRNRPEKAFIPGLFVQDEWRPAQQHTILLGARMDQHPVHGTIFTPRLAWKWKAGRDRVLRLNAGTGFRVVSLFTEDHAALTGARAVEIREALRPEKSYNVNLNYNQTWRWEGHSLEWDFSAWYSHFRNQIIPDYDSDPNKIIYQNLNGHSRSTGISGNLNFSAGHRFRLMAGATIQNVRKTEYADNHEAIHTRPVLTEKWSAVWQMSYTIPAWALTIDYTGNCYGPMRLPLISSLDPRPGNSPVWSIQNIQFTRRMQTNFEIFAGVKNLLNWTPARNIPFLIARTNDPFDKNLQYGPDGQVLPTADNPYGLSFDPSYIYAPNQGIRMFAGIRWWRK